MQWKDKDKHIVWKKWKRQPGVIVLIATYVIFINHDMYQHTLNTCFPFQCFWYNCLFNSFDIMMILIMITLIIIMIILMMINIIILYICSISSFSLHITCFQEWTCELCDGIFWCERNYECHKKICCGMNAYWCDLCGNVYRSRKSLCGHKRKHHTDDVCYFVFFV